MRALVDSRLTPSLPEGFFPVRLTIQSRSTDLDSAGQPVENWSNVAGLVDLPLVTSPQSLGGSFEARREGYTAGRDELFANLTGYFPQILVAQRALIGGVAHDILGVDHSASLNLTRLRLERVTT